MSSDKTLHPVHFAVQCEVAAPWGLAALTQTTPSRQPVGVVLVCPEAT